MAAMVPVTVQDLGGKALQQEMSPSDKFEQLIETISTEWSLDKRSFRLLAGTAVLKKDAQLDSIAPPDGSALEVQLLKFDPLLDLGHFEPSEHTGVKVCCVDSEDHSQLVKSSSNPDSNNVFLRHAIREPCFVEFRIVRTLDEMSIGVTYDMEKVKQVSGFANLGAKNTWVYSKKKAMPALQFAGSRLNPPKVAGIKEGDVVTVFVDPEKRLVNFWRNGIVEASNLPEYPLPCPDEHPLWIYAMVDAVGDTISVVRFGPGEPFE
mmetsp:Transcript_132857/g.234119  ORF Transcript_132857/g.234119 Transcript_132857/m.234119 type:complete len:264 (-) Transcript_132857:612-1403(-)